MKRGFERYEIDPRILEKLPELGFKRPTAVQEKVIPLLIQGKNILVEAPTGSGKTAAYGFPCLTGINLNKRAVQALILVPSRELARQVEDALKSYSTQDMLKIEAIYGGSPIKDSEVKLAKNPHVLVAVPGRLRDLLRDEKFPYFWRNINFLVIDEADRLLEQGFQEEVLGFLPYIKKGTQISLYSATLSEDIESFAKEKFGDLIPVKLWAGAAWKSISFFKVDVPEGQTEHALVSLIQSRKIENALIFCNKRSEVYSLSRFLRANGIRCEAYHGLMDQVERDAVMNRFRLRQIQFLIATDLAARGLDIQDLDAVINFSFPDESEVYLHRVGRTGRAGRKGECYSLITSDMEGIYLQSFHKQANIPIKNMSLEIDKSLRIQAEPEEKIMKVTLSRGKEDKIRNSDIVGFLVKDCGIPAEEIGTISVYDDHSIVDLPKRQAQVLVEAGLEHKLKGKSLKIRFYGLDEEKARAGKVQKLVVSSKTREAKRKRQAGQTQEKPRFIMSQKPEIPSKAGADKKKRGKFREEGRTGSKRGENKHGASHSQDARTSRQENPEGRKPGAGKGQKGRGPAPSGEGRKKRPVGKRGK